MSTLSEPQRIRLTVGVLAAACVLLLLLWLSAIVQQQTANQQRDAALNDARGQATTAAQAIVARDAAEQARTRAVARELAANAMRSCPTTRS